jgi:hypothetical protein
MSFASAPARAEPTPVQHFRDLLLLAKPRLSGLVVLTSAGGLALAPGRIGAGRAVLTILGTAAVVGAANALNCWLEREVDARMRRTRDRPLPAGRVEPFEKRGEKSPKPLKTVKANEKGEYEVPLPPGEYTVVAEIGGKLYLNLMRTDPQTSTVTASGWVVPKSEPYQKPDGTTCRKVTQNVSKNGQTQSQDVTLCRTQVAQADGSNWVIPQ